MVSCEMNRMQSYLILKCVPSHRIQRGELCGGDVLLFFQESFPVMGKRAHDEDNNTQCASATCFIMHYCTESSQVLCVGEILFCTLQRKRLVFSARVLGVMRLPWLSDQHHLSTQT